MLKKAFLVLSGNAFSSFVLLLRNLIVARLLSVEDYGVAATFALSMAVVEMMSTLGLHQLIVQSEKGDDPELQAGLQGFHLFRGVLSGGGLFLLANPIAQFLGIPEVAWAYQVLALVPVLRGFIHFDVYRLNRNMEFLPLIASTLVPALLSMLLVWPFFAMFGDFQVLLYAYLVQWGGMTIASHFVAKRCYRLVLNRHSMGLALRFGWPLLINNMLLLAVFQGEKLIVGREMGMTSLAILAMGFTLTLTPTLVAARSMQTFFLPQLSANQANRVRFGHLALAALQAGLFGGLLLVVAVAFLGEPVVGILLGEKYATLFPLLTWLAALQALRLFKSGCAIVALSQGQTANAMIGNSFRVLSLSLSWMVAANGGNLLTILWIAIAAEVCGYLTMLSLVGMRTKLGLQPMLLPIVMAMVVLVVAALRTEVFSQYLETTIWASLSLVALFFLSIATMGDLRQYILKRK